MAIIWPHKAARRGFKEPTVSIFTSVRTRVIHPSDPISHRPISFEMKLFYILSLIVAGVAGHGGSRRANRGLASLSTEEKRLHNGARYAKIIQACSEQLGFGSKFKITVG